jgi:hypothetical protein
MKSCEDRVEKLIAIINEFATEEATIDEVAALKLDTENFISDRNHLLKK